MKTITDYIEKYPNLEYVYGLGLFADSEADEPILEDCEFKWLLEEYYNDSYLPIAHPSGNPELETEKLVDGKEYIEQFFEGDYILALKEA